MKNKLSYIVALAVIFCWCFFSLQGCKDPIIEDTDLLTSDDDLNLAKDTLHIKVFSEFVDPVVSSSVLTGLLGTISDPNFGNTYAGFYGQCGLSTNNIYFGENPVLDSAVLTFAYTGSYGKFDQAVNISVYEVVQTMIDSIIYKTTDAFQVSLPAIGQLNSFIPNLTDSITLMTGEKYPAHLRIPLTQTFGSRLLTADTNILRDNTSFLNLFKGFYITTASSPTGNGLVYLGLSSSMSEITLYYHNNTEDSLLHSFPVGGVRVNHIDNSYSGTPVYTSVNNPNPSGEGKMYLQGGAGLKGKVFITDLDSLPKNIAINKAELILSQTAGDTQYLAPLILDLFRIDDAKQAVELEDDGSSGFGGVRMAETVDGVIIYRYRFNIKQYFQKLLQGVYNNNGFYVQTLAPYSQSERVVIGNSTTDKNYQVSLVVTYTKL